MGVVWQCMLFVLSLSFFCYATAQTVVVDISNDLPKTSNAALVISCDKGSSFTLRLGLHSKRTVVQDSECTLTWTPVFATVDDYQTQRDNGHPTVYWSVRIDGFYQSYDASNWKFVQPWNSD
ncbi:hypothetical protein Fmac_009073 [Flemingia macrophylla]|uniref:Uncharacterized protein n=1 Tax=Flemingia macrophylla TaxID=520843 RepID=A0ABD1N0D8_9FABA